MSNIYSTVGRSVTNIYDQGTIYLLVGQIYIDAMDQPTILYIYIYIYIYTVTMVTTVGYIP